MEGEDRFSILLKKDRSSTAAGFIIACDLRSVIIDILGQAGGMMKLRPKLFLLQVFLSVIFIGIVQN